MGFPSYVLRRCPVVTMTKTCYSKDLSELILILMTGELGAGQIATIIAKKRASFWVSHAKVYLEAHVHNKDDRSSLRSFGFTRTDVCKPFPVMISHCNGFGGTKGPSQNQIQRYFLAASSHPANFGDRFMKSLGGQVITQINSAITMGHFHRFRDSFLFNYRCYLLITHSTFLHESNTLILGTILMHQLRVYTAVSLK